MGSIFRPDSPAMIFLSKMGTLIILNLLWLLFCIPIITIGPATVALYSAARRFSAEKEWPPLWKTFWGAFTANFRQALLVFLCLAPMVCLSGLYVFRAVVGVRSALWFEGLCWLAIMLTAFVCAYAFPLIAHFENTVGGTLKNAILLPVLSPLVTLAMGLLNLLPVLLMVWNLPLFVRCSIFWLAIGGALTAYINTKLLERVFRRFNSNGGTT